MFRWAIIGVVVVVVIVLISILTKKKQPAPTEQADDNAESAMDILKKRYANGEISTEEFEQRRRTLERN